MNSKKRIFAKCTLMMALVPFHTQASSGHIGLEACADALVSELSASNGSAVNYQLDPANEDMDRKLQSLELFSLYARDPSSSELVSRMDCVVNNNGKVIRLTNKPLSDEEITKQVSKVD
jgi:hypothetical protein